MKSIKYAGPTLGIALMLSSCATSPTLTSRAGFATQQEPSEANFVDAYFGQAAPGLTPAPFAPGVVSTENWEYGAAFTPDLKSFYHIRSGGDYERMTFVEHRYSGGQWKEFEISPRVGQPFISPDGQTMHLGGRYKDRLENGWSAIKKLGGDLSNYQIMRLTASNLGTYYFDEVGTDGDGVIRYSRIVDGKRETARIADPVINTGSWLAHPFIAPDESYILWDGRRDDGNGSSDIYVSFKRLDGSWGQAKNLGPEVNTDAWEAAASITPDGKYLLFHRNVGSDAYENVDIFWVDAAVVYRLKDKDGL